MSLPSPSLAQPAEESRAPTKYVLITGGVTASSIGVILKACGLRVSSVKIDPYLNTNAGTISPFERGGVFVLDDGGEVDLDLGNYYEVTICICFKHGEHFLDVTLTRDDNITTGKIYQSIIEMERRGDYLGKTVQDEIKWWIQSGYSVPVDGRTRPADVSVKLVGTVGKDKTMASLEDHLIPMVVLWDIENCNVPNKAQVEAISKNIRNALKRMDPAIAKATIQTYGIVPAKIKEGLQRTGVIHVDILNRKKDAADKMILRDMLRFALDNSPPAGILLISGDADFAPTVRELVHRGYNMVIALPSQGTASSDLTAAGTHAWDWPSLARGEGIVNRRSSPADLGTLKSEMIWLFESHAGRIDVSNILSKYTKMFNKQIKLSDYHAPKLVDLFMKMGEPFSVVERKVVSLNMQFDQGSTSGTTVGLECRLQ